jgi:hypothetical protein
MIPLLLLGTLLVAASLPAAPTGARGGSARALERSAQSCSPRLEHDARWRTVTVRGPGADCATTTIGVAELAELLERGLDVAAGPDLDALESVFLGRVESYPELGAALLEAAAADRAWSPERPPGAREANRWVADALATSAAFEPVRRGLAAHGLEASGLSCEKVLVVTAHPSVPGWARDRLGLPFDALCWIRLAAR